MCDTEGHTHAHPHDFEHDHGHHAPVDPDAFRVVVTGKGGVGKTTLTALLARILARRRRVLALDADPQMNLPYALGLAPALARSLVPISQNPDYVEEKTGARPGIGYGLMFSLNPEVEDAVERFGVVGPDGVRLMVMGTVVQPAAGCLCPENALLASLVKSLSVREGEVILMDTQAGVEHFGRALAEGFRHAVVVTDPSFNGAMVALQAARLAAGLGIPAVHLVVNRVRGRSDHEKVRRILDAEGGFPFRTEHALSFDGRLLEVEPGVGPLLGTRPSSMVQGAEGLAAALVREEAELARCAS